MRDEATPGDTAAAMASAVGALAGALSPESRSRLVFPFSDEGRFDWHFIPRARSGLSFKDLEGTQREKAHAALRHGLSDSGYEKVQIIMGLEDVLRERERSARRDRDLYFFRVFGEPGSAAPWGWTFEGHHLSLNYTIVGDRLAATPTFLGANPAEVHHGVQKGTRALAAEEDLARTLMRSLDAPQRKDALVSTEAPSDILTGVARRASPLKPAGLAAARLTGQQVETLMGLLRTYAAAMPADVATRRMRTLRSAGVDRICFAWAGGIERGQGHYYRVQGPSFLVEYDNTQNDANHIHTVWRDFDGDFGVDLLAEHHRAAHHRA